MEGDITTKRMQLLAIGLAIVVGIMFLRLIQLQVLRHDYYSILATQSHQRKYEIPSLRGQIYAQDHNQKVPLALNRNLKTLYADGRYVQDPESEAQQLAKLTGEPTNKYRELLASKQPYIVLKKQIEPNVAKAINDLQLPGIGLADAITRTYPESSLAAQVLGFVNAEGKGQYGIEEYFNGELSGKSGLLSAKTDSRGIPIATNDNIQVAPINGSDIVLTIDRNIQAKVEAVLKAGVEKHHAKGASAVVLEANTGAIKAMANYPTYDPANFQSVDDYNVFANTAVQGQFEPGSNFKTFTMSAALNTGAIKPETTFTNSGSRTFDEYTIKNAGGIPTGVFTMKQVIEKSINTGVVFALEQLGGGALNSAAKNKLHDYFTNHFKFGQATGVELANEASGQIEGPQGASDITYANMTFGQGLTATVLQVASATAAVANGGTLYKPHIVAQKINADGTVTVTKPQVRANQVITAQTSNQLKDMMEAVVNTGGGFGTKTPGYRIAGKTGTAQIPNPQGGYFDNRDIGSFTGFAPVENPKYVMMVRIDEPVTPGFAGSAAAGPMFGDIMRWLLQYEGIPPSS